ncbi:MAG: hypothetical protein J6M17_02725 [Ruminococcus sp.]|nr:hypothetical protein [Ruminococcus sp.]
MFRKNKPDEMEKDIQHKSVVAAHYFTEAALAVWIVISLIKGASAVVPLYILLAELLVRGVSVLVYRRDLGDDRWKKGIVVLISAAAVVLFVLMFSFGGSVSGGRS